MEKYGFGVDVGGTSCKLGLFTDSGKLMEKWEIPTDTSEQGEHIIEHVAASLERRQRERGLADEQIEQQQANMNDHSGDKSQQKTGTQLRCAVNLESRDDSARTDQVQHYKGKCAAVLTAENAELDECICAKCDNKQGTDLDK